MQVKPEEEINPHSNGNGDREAHSDCTNCNAAHQHNSYYVHHIIYPSTQNHQSTPGFTAGQLPNQLRQFLEFNNPNSHQRQAPDQNQANDDSNNKFDDRSEEKTVFFKLPGFKKKNNIQSNGAGRRTAKQAINKKHGPDGSKTEEHDENESKNSSDDFSPELNADSYSNNRSTLNDRAKNQEEKDSAKDEAEESTSDEKTNDDSDEWAESLKAPKVRQIWHGLTGIAVTLFGVVIPSFLFFASIASAPKRFTLVLLHHPVETAVELLAVIAIPVINYLVWNALCKGRTNVSRWLIMALGAASATSLSLAGVCIASLFGASQDLQNSIGTDFSFGFTWLAMLSGIAAAVSIFLINKLRLSWELQSSRLKVVAQALGGVLLTLLAFAGAEYRPWCIRMAQHQAVDVDKKTRTAGLAWLRSLNPEREMRMECSDTRAAGFAGLFFPLKQSTQHQLYFTLTGTPYSFRDMNATDLSSMPDDYLKRQVVGDVIPNFVLTRSSLTGNLHSNTLSSTLDWTFVVKNGNSYPQEARAEIGLPPGAAVTGLTVWRRGEPENAEFVASGKVQDVQMTTMGNDSPGMVTDLGHGRVLLHASPVPPEEELKIRVTMVVPMRAEGDTSSSLLTPQLIATNFGLKGEHSVRLRSQTALSSSSTLEKGTSPTGEKVISGQLSQEQLETNAVSIFAERKPMDKPIAILDKISTNLNEQYRKEHEAFLRAKAKANAETPEENKLKEVVVMIDGSKGVNAQIEQLTRMMNPVKKKNAPAKKTRIRTIQPHYLVESINRSGAAAPKHLVVVIDGSKSMKDYMGQVESALRQIPSTVPTSVIIASQEHEDLAKPAMLSSRLSDLKNLKFFQGGQDNLKSVVKGSELAGETKGGALLWIHGPQPVINEEIYIMSPYTATPSFYELSLGAGTDTFEFFKNHAEIGPFCQIPRDANKVDKDLGAFFSKWKPGTNSYSVVLNDKTKVPAEFIAPSADEARELTQLRAAQECQRLISTKHFKKAARMAVAYGLVSPVSSAVVGMQGKQDADADDVNAQTEASSPDSNTDSSSASDSDGSSAPTLQGATNGTVGPQGGDATVIMGVNTAGTVRVNNLANLEALLNIIANLGEILSLVGGAWLVLQGLTSKDVLKLGEDFEFGPQGKVALGLFIVTMGLALPGIINWFVASARDANLFS